MQHDTARKLHSDEEQKLNCIKVLHFELKFIMKATTSSPDRPTMNILWNSMSLQLSSFEEKQTKHTEVTSRHNNQLWPCSQRHGGVRTSLQHILRHICAPKMMFPLRRKQVSREYLAPSISKNTLTHLIKCNQVDILNVIYKTWTCLSEL